LIRIALVTPNPALRVGLRGIMGQNPDLAIAGEAGDLFGLEVPASQVDVLVLAAVPALKSQDLPSETAILVLTDRRENLRTLAGLTSQAWGILPLEATEEEIYATLHALSEGLWVGAPSLVRDLFKQPAVVALSGSHAPVEAVTKRETEVLQLIARGLSNKQIAMALGISEHTVKFHLSSLYAKLGATSRTEAVHIGTQQGLIVM
jgi:DNA-binding NarL/FixJ family response regulator